MVRKKTNLIRVDEDTYSLLLEIKRKESFNRCIVRLLDTFAEIYFDDEKGTWKFEY